MCCRVRHPKLNGFLPKYVVCVKSTGSIKAFNYSCILSVRTDCESGARKDKEDMVSTFPVFFLQVCCERGPLHVQHVTSRPSGQCDTSLL